MIFKRRIKPTEIKSLDDLQPMLDDERPILIDFYQFNCRSCKVMDGIVNELAEEYSESAHVVKVNVGTVPGAVQQFKIQSTPTFVVLGRSQKKPSKKARKKSGAAADPGKAPMTPRWRASGLVKKDTMAQMLERNGAA